MKTSPESLGGDPVLAAVAVARAADKAPRVRIGE
jgi:hypothetical protein